MDRQDIDALLIGALYGELTPADEARLAAHLESHPADKTALDGMKTAREAVKQSRIFEAQAEPPQAVSAILLQEAARRAPKPAPDPERRESWFFRFMRSFAAHPAMAAAAMLVVVVGVAGTLYMRNGDQFADKTAGAPETAQLTATPPAAPADQPREQDKDTAAATGAGSATYNVGLAEEGQVRAREQQQAAKTEAQVDDKPEPKRAEKSKAPADDFAKKESVAHSAPKKGYLEVTTPERTPKELDSKNDEIAQADTADGEMRVGGAGGAAPAGQAANMPATTSIAAAPPPPPPAAVKQAPTKAAAKPTAAPEPAQSKFAEAPPPQAAQPQGPATNSPLLAWAKSQHAEAIARVRKGDCSGAATIAVQVRTRAPDYFAQNMRDDRELKSCTAYINDAVDKEERASSKTKASKKAASDSK